MKRNLLLLIAVAFIMTACNQNKNFNVNVSLANGNDKTVYLQKYVDNVPVTIDSAVIAEEKAVLTAPIDNPQILYALKIKGQRGSMPFFADNKDVAFVGDLNNPQAVEIMGSETQAELDAYNDQLDEINMQIRDLYAVMQQAFSDNDSIKMDSLNKVGTALMEQQDNFRDEYIKAHPESFVTHYILDGVKQDYPLDQLKDLMAGFTTESIYRDHLNDYVAKQERLEVGQPFIDFTLQTKDGEDVTLSEKIAQNKLTLVDFWASWCGPCRHENPVVKAAYEKYHELGFEVVGVSVDQDEAAWLKAVEEDELPWMQVRDSEDKVSEDYMIYYIPSNFLFDQNGTMIAKGLRGEDLEAKLAEILK
ncbi:MAG: alkyl hydroperoxide reductase [bacterium F082]|nr:MAG: alkyl hydroperoxide reductase [bacterium F082]KWW28873.1 MAG: alkyl hydroperoxide reductase [bacterium P201]